MTPLEVLLISCLAFYVGLRLSNAARDAEIRLLRAIIAAGAEDEPVQQAARREAAPWN